MGYKDPFTQGMVKISSIPGVQVGEEVVNAVIKAIEKTLQMEKSEDCEVSILLTDDSEIQRLNKLYRSVDAPTDVLAFAMREGVDGDLSRSSFWKKLEQKGSRGVPPLEILGDVVISIPTAERQAGIYGHSLLAEMSLLAAHGVLHLLGYEHGEDNDEAKVMEQKQKDILRLLGYGIE